MPRVMSASPGMAAVAGWPPGGPPPPVSEKKVQLLQGGSWSARSAALLETFAGRTAGQARMAVAQLPG